MIIDWWTLGFQTVNVAILVWLLQHFFWTPVSAMIEQRRAAAQVILSDAESKRTEANAALADIAKTRAGFAQEGETIRTTAHAAAEQDRTAQLAEATKAAANSEAAVCASIVKEREASETATANRASSLAVDIARRLAARLTGSTIEAAFLQWLVGAIKALPDAARQAAGATDAIVEIISATPIAAEDEARYRQQISQALAAKPHITFDADPTLIAGLELHGPNLLVTNSWRADLAQIRSDLTHDAQH